MKRKNTRNNDLLKESKTTTSQPIYSLLLKLVNDDREDLAEAVLKVDYLIEYAVTCIRQRDYNEAREGLHKAKIRIDMLKTEGVDAEYLDFLYEGADKKCKVY